MNAILEPHPAWCSPRCCDVTPDLPADGGQHRSEPIALDLQMAVSPHGFISHTTVHLQQADCPWQTPVYLVLAADGREMFMPLPAAVGVLARMVELAATVDPTR